MNSPIIRQLFANSAARSSENIACKPIYLQGLCWVWIEPLIKRLANANRNQCFNYSPHNRYASC